MFAGVGGASYGRAMSTIPAPSRQSAHLFLEAVTLSVDGAQPAAQVGDADSALLVLATSTAR